MFLDMWEKVVFWLFSLFEILEDEILKLVCWFIIVVVQLDKLEDFVFIW